MIGSELLDEVRRLTAERESFALATVVRARRPTSVRPGDCALVRHDGTIDGFVGGVCAQASVRLHALRAMETGEALLLRLVPDDGDDGGARRAEAAGDGLQGAVVERNPCLSGGALELFIEPHLPAARLVIVGETPIARALEAVGAAAGYDCLRAAASEPQPIAVSGAAAVIVASHGNGEEVALSAALTAGVPYVALVASPTRGAAVRDELDVAPALGAQLHTPAGLDIGARTPAEIAISILAEVVASRHAHPLASARTAVDPVCGMTVAISPATPQLRDREQTVYFCGPGCRTHYAAR